MSKNKNNNFRRGYEIPKTNGKTRNKTTSREGEKNKSKLPKPKISRKRKLRIARRVGSLGLCLTFILSAGSIALKKLYEENINNQVKAMQEILKNELNSNTHMPENYKNNLELAIHYADCMIGQKLTDEQIEILADKLKALKKENIRLAIIQAVTDEEYIEDYGIVTDVYYDENNNIIVISTDNGKEKETCFRTESEEVQSSDGNEPVVKKVSPNVNRKLEKLIKGTNEDINSQTALEKYLLDIAEKIPIEYVHGDGDVRGEQGDLVYVPSISAKEIIKQYEEQQEQKKNEERQKRIEKELEQKIAEVEAEEER